MIFDPWPQLLLRAVIAALATIVIVVCFGRSKWSRFRSVLASMVFALVFFAIPLVWHAGDWHADLLILFLGPPIGAGVAAFVSGRLWQVNAFGAFLAGFVAGSVVCELIHFIVLKLDTVSDRFVEALIIFVPVSLLSGFIGAALGPGFATKVDGD